MSLSEEWSTPDFLAVDSFPDLSRYVNQSVICFFLTASSVGFGQQRILPLLIRVFAT